MNTDSRSRRNENVLSKRRSRDNEGPEEAPEAKESVAAGLIQNAGPLPAQGPPGPVRKRLKANVQQNEADTVQEMNVLSERVKQLTNRTADIVRQLQLILGIQKGDATAIYGGYLQSQGALAELQRELAVLENDLANQNLVPVGVVRDQIAALNHQIDELNHTLNETDQLLDSFRTTRAQFNLANKLTDSQADLDKYFGVYWFDRFEEAIKKQVEEMGSDAISPDANVLQIVSDPGSETAKKLLQEARASQQEYLDNIVSLVEALEEEKKHADDENKGALDNVLAKWKTEKEQVQNRLEEKGGVLNEALYLAQTAVSQDPKIIKTIQKKQGKEEEPEPEEPAPKEPAPEEPEPNEPEEKQAEPTESKSESETKEPSTKKSRSQREPQPESMIEPEEKKEAAYVLGGVANWRMFENDLTQDQKNNGQKVSYLNFAYLGVTGTLPVQTAKRLAAESRLQEEAQAYHDLNEEQTTQLLKDALFWNSMFLQEDQRPGKFELINALQGIAKRLGLCIMQFAPLDKKDARLTDLMKTLGEEQLLNEMRSACRTNPNEKNSKQFVIEPATWQTQVAQVIFQNVQTSEDVIGYFLVSDPDQLPPEATPHFYGFAQGRHSGKNAALIDFSLKTTAFGESQGVPKITEELQTTTLDLTFLCAQRSAEYPVLTKIGHHLGTLLALYFLVHQLDQGFTGVMLDVVAQGTQDSPEGIPSGQANSDVAVYYHKTFKFQRTNPVKKNTRLLYSKSLALLAFHADPDWAAYTLTMNDRKERKTNLMYRPYPTVIDLRFMVARLVKKVTQYYELNRVLEL